MSGEPRGKARRAGLSLDWLCGCSAVRPTGFRRVRLQYELSKPVLGGTIVNGADQGEVASLSVDHERARREGDVAAPPVALLPDAEAKQFQAIELATDELQFGIRELVRTAYSPRGERC